MKTWEQIQIVLTAGQWQEVVRFLGKQAYEDVAPYIVSINTQCMQAEMRAASVSDKDNG